MLKTKRCPCCGKTLPTTEFYKCEKRKDGLQPYCKGCMKTKSKERGKANTLKKSGKASKRRAVKDDAPISVEASQQEFIDTSVIKTKTPIIYRGTTNMGDRFYFRKDTGDSGNEVAIYASVTNAIKAGYADEHGVLEKWEVEQRLAGRDPDIISMERADVGTCMHYLNSLYLMGQEFKLSTAAIANELKKASKKLHLKFGVERVIENNAEELLTSLISFAKFCHDYEVKPIFIEKMLCSDKHGFASAIDIYCWMTIEVMGFFGEVYKTNSGENKAGDPKKTKGKIRIKALIDMKSSRSGSFYPEHKLQLGSYRVLMSENFPDEQVDKVYNWSPKAWSKTSQYHLKDQTDDSDEFKKLLSSVLVQGVLKFKEKSLNVTQYKGSLKIDKENDFENIMETSNVVELIEKKK